MKINKIKDNFKTMVFNSNDIAKKVKVQKHNVGLNIDLSTLNSFCRYLLQDTRVLRMEHLVNLRRLFSLIKRETYENDPEKIKRVDFIYKALEARLDYNLTDTDLILLHINGGITYKIEFIDYDNIIMDKANVLYIHKMVEDLLKYAFIYNHADEYIDILTKFKSVDISKRMPVIQEFETMIHLSNNEFRKAHIEDNLNDVTFSLEDGTFESAVTDTYNIITNPSRRLYTGMQGINEMIGSGFESGRVYMLLGVAGVGKSLTLLNVLTQIKKYNTMIKPKDPSKIPCIVLLTMENTVIETLTRLFDMVVDNSKGMANYALNEVVYKLRDEGGLRITESSPLDIVIKYKPNRSISTDYLYTLYDDLLDQGKEPVCVIQDHIKRIRSIDGSQDLRLELGDVVNEFKVFAADKDIPLITVSHLNRDATRILEEASRKGNADSGKLLGKSNTGESLLMIDNLDCAMTIARDYDKDGLCYMTFHRIKMRDKGSDRDYIAQPFLPDNPIRLVEDFGGIPQFKESIHNLPSLPVTSNNIRVDGASSLNKVIDINDFDDNDNAFTKGNIQSITLTNNRINNSNDELNSQMEQFDEELSELIIENITNNINTVNNINDIYDLPSNHPIEKAIIINNKPVKAEPAFVFMK